MAYTDRFPIVNNFLETRLSADCDEGETTLYLESVDALPRILAGRDYIPLVLRDAGSVREIVYVDSVDVDSGAIVVKRGQEGTNSVAWSAGSYVYCTVTADSFQRMRVNGFAPLVDGTSGRPEISVTSSTTAAIVGDYTAQVEVGMAVRVLAGDSVVEPNDATMGAIHISGVEYSGSVTNIAFQNVTLPKNVSGLDLGISVAAAPLYHPDTIVADNDTTSQVGNVISADLAVQKAVHEAQQGDSALDTTLRALIAQEVAKYFLLDGSKPITGVIEINRPFAHIHRSNNEGRTVIRGGAGAPENGASLYLYGAKDADYPGRVVLQNVNADGSYDSVDIYNGKVLISGKDAVRSVNGNEASDSGGVRLWAEDKSDADLNSLLEPGTYYINGGANIPSGSNGYVIVEGTSPSSALRQIFYRVGTVNSNEHNIYTRARSGGNVWGEWVKMLTSKDDANVDSKSIGANGYVRFVSGLQICWGKASQNAWNSFPKAFSDAPAVVATHAMGSTSGERPGVSTYIEKSRFYFADGDGSGKYTAIGPWK